MAWIQLAGSNSSVPRPCRLGRPGSGFSDGPPGAAEAKSGMGLAARMMEKMGWKEGQGLGKLRQGMVTPLVAQKTDARSGVIVNAEGPPEKRPRTGARPKACDVRGAGLGTGQRCVCRAWHAQGGPCGGGLVCALGLLGMHLPVGAMLRKQRRHIHHTCPNRLFVACWDVHGRAEGRGRAQAWRSRARRRAWCCCATWSAPATWTTTWRTRRAAPLPCWHALPGTCMGSYCAGGQRPGGRGAPAPAMLARCAMHMQGEHCAGGRRARGGGDKKKRSVPPVVPTCSATHMHGELWRWWTPSLWTGHGTP